MRNSGRVTPALFFLGPDGQGMFCPESLADDRAKFLTIIRSGNGKFFGFGESEDPGADEMKAASRSCSQRKPPTPPCAISQKSC